MPFSFLEDDIYLVELAHAVLASQSPPVLGPALSALLLLYCGIIGLLLLAPVNIPSGCTTTSLLRTRKTLYMIAPRFNTYDTIFHHI